MTVAVPVFLLALPIALLVVLPLALFRAAHRKKGRRLLEALERDPAAARTLVDTLYPPATKVGPFSVVTCRQRLAGLALCGDAQAIEAELPRFTGPARFCAQVRSIGLLGLALCGPNADGATVRLHRLQVEFNSTPIERMMAQNVKMLALLAQMIAQHDSTLLPVERIEKTVADGALTMALVRRAVESVSRTGARA
jgi:hypothetical protein